MINRIILALTLIVSTAIASEPNHIVLDELNAQSTDHTIVARNTLLLKKAFLRSADLHKINSAGSDIVEKFLIKNGTSAPFSAIEVNREAGQEMLDQVLDKNLPTQSIRRSKRASVKKHITHFVAKL